MKSLQLIQTTTAHLSRRSCFLTKTDLSRHSCFTNEDGTEVDLLIGDPSKAKVYPPIFKAGEASLASRN